MFKSQWRFSEGGEFQSHRSDEAAERDKSERERGMGMVSNEEGGGGVWKLIGFCFRFCERDEASESESERETDRIG